MSPPAGEPAAASEVRVQLMLLNGFELRCEGKRVDLPLSAQRLVAYLALHGRPLLRIHVAGMLWLDASEGRSCANLRSALWRLRRPGHEVVEATQSHVGLAREVSVDVREVVAVARRLLDGSSGPWSDELDATLSGELLPDWYDDWVLAERERLRQLRLHALEAFAEQLGDEGRYAQAIDVALAAVRGDPLRESAHRVLIKLHLAEGNHGEALRQYRAYRDRLRDQLGLEPSPQMQELVGALTRRAVTLR